MGRGNRAGAAYQAQTSAVAKKTRGGEALGGARFEIWGLSRARSSAGHDLKSASAILLSFVKSESDALVCRGPAARRSAALGMLSLGEVTIVSFLGLRCTRPDLSFVRSAPNKYTILLSAWTAAFWTCCSQKLYGTV